MNREQKKHLTERLENIGRTVRNRESKVPAHVQKAYATVEQWEKEQQVAYEKQNRLLMAEIRDIRTMILFGSPDEALTAVINLERKYKI